MKRVLAAVGDTGAAPGSSTKASFQNRKEMRKGLEGGFSILFFISSSIQARIEQLLGSRRKRDRESIDVEM